MQFIPPSSTQTTFTGTSGTGTSETGTEAGAGASAGARVMHAMPPRVLSAGGMDGVVTLWDVGKSGGVSGQPRKLCAAEGLHHSGIFSMHAAWGWDGSGGSGSGSGGGGGGGGVSGGVRCGQTVVRLLTGSKDATVCLSRVEDRGITAERSFAGHHGGVVKCVRRGAVRAANSSFDPRLERRLVVSNPSKEG